MRPLIRGFLIGLPLAVLATVAVNVLDFSRPLALAVMGVVVGAIVLYSVILLDRAERSRQQTRQ